MSYTKNEWATNDVVTAVKLNNIENGIEAVDSGKIAMPSGGATGNVLKKTETGVEWGEGGGGGASSWNDLTDRPFYEETVQIGPAEAGDTKKFADLIPRISKSTAYNFSNLLTVKPNQVYNNSSTPYSSKTEWDDSMIEENVSFDGVDETEYVNFSLIYVNSENLSAAQEFAEDIGYTGTLTEDDYGVYAAFTSDGETYTAIDHINLTIIKKLDSKFLESDCVLFDAQLRWSHGSFSGIDLDEETLFPLLSTHKTVRIKLWCDYEEDGAAETDNIVRLFDLIEYNKTTQTAKFSYVRAYSSKTDVYMIDTAWDSSKEEFQTTFKGYQVANTVKTLGQDPFATA